MRALHILLFAIYGLITTFAAQVCSSDSCLPGSSSSLLLAQDESSDTYLTPGTHHSDAQHHIDITQTPNSHINQTITLTPDSLVVSLPPQPILTSEKLYREDIGGGGDWRSAFLPAGWYAVISPGQVLWGAIPDSRQLPDIPSNKIIFTALSTCDPSCASGGICKIENDNSTSCACKIGWGGAVCDVCAQGHYGIDCTPCAEDCSQCDDGISGTGRCLGTTSTPLKACNCSHGSCSTSGDCICAAGYVTNSTSTTKCTECAKGFFRDINENCLACPLGCASCGLKDGTDSTPSCTSCLFTLSMSTSDPVTCSTSGSCADGQYFDTNTSTCQSCSPACVTCTGPSTSDCLACTSPRVTLQGSCVGFDPSTGICDSSLSGLQGVFVVSNEKRKCEACPVGCLECALPSFSSGAAYSAVYCKGCQDGYLSESGKCVKTCSEGYFLPEGAGKNGTCQRCDASCIDCIGTSTTCTNCATPNLASNGVCINLCPSATYPLNGTCMTCPPDCATCSGPSAGSCLSCPSTRPVLSDGRCLHYCSSDQYFDATNRLCKSCDISCGACSGPSPGECTTCIDGLKLDKGTCKAANCKNGYVAGMGVCLEDLVDTTNTHRWFAFIVLPFVLAAIGVGFWWYVRAERRKTRQATAEFGNQMDEREVRDKMMILRLEKMLGLDRIRPSLRSYQIREHQEEGDRGWKRDRMRLKELWLLGKKTRSKKRDVGPGETDDHAENGQVRYEQMEMRNKKDWAGGERDSHWFAPPPPYVVSEASSSTSAIDTIALNPLGDPKTKIISMGCTSPLSPASPVDDSFPTRPMLKPLPPPRPSVRTPAGSGPYDGKEVDRRRADLLDLWPNLPVSPGFGGTPTEEENRELGSRMRHGMI